MRSTVHFSSVRVLSLMRYSTLGAGSPSESTRSGDKVDAVALLGKVLGVCGPQDAVLRRSRDVMNGWSPHVFEVQLAGAPRSR